MKLLVLLFTIFLVSCSSLQKRDADLYDYSDKRVDELYLKFLKLAIKHDKVNKGYKNVYFFKTFEHIHHELVYAECDMHREVIFINIEAWYELTDEVQELVFFHELGHCFLKKVHPIGTVDCAKNQDMMCSELATVKPGYRENPLPYLENLFRD